nr:protocadherin Fat 1 isoform X2 [Helicoverpa armigera]XP_049703142.1 protocadherin Fat 1 isoform X6 [Helicoverpa armigera]
MAKLIIFLLFLTTYFCISHGCRVVGTSWPNPVSGSVVDTYRGVILDIETRGIDGIESVTYGAAINYTQYVDFNFIDSRLVASTNPLFDEYEEKQTVLVMQAAVTFRCSDGSSPVTYNFFINVVDTNNNAPQFWDAVERQPRDEFEFTVIAPLPPGFEITGCLDDLIVRDIDLTTSRIDFAIEDNDYFEIEYGGLTVAKEFQGILKTKTLIRSIPEPITLTISATDVDDTGDPPITTKGKITIIGDREFEMPEEPVFTKAFYLADYTEDNRVVLEETISLRSGYHSDVDFSIEGEFKNNFEIVPNPQYENQMSIGVTIPLTGDVLDQPNVLLAVKANREHTSGASTTVVVRLPQGIPLEFERAHYEGTIESNILDVPPLILTQGYEGTVVSANVISDYTSNFNAVVQGNTITLSMTPLAESIINENSFIYLQIVASTDRSITTTVVTLEIIKDDNITPVFNQPIYTGSYNPGADLSIEQISFTQGYDGIDSLELFGDNSNYFTATRVGAAVRITVSTIPPALYSLGRIVLSLEATKPRTVGASATLIINLPGARELGFESSTYRGSLRNNVLTLDPIPLTLGYDENIDFSITGDYASNFRVSKEENRAIIRLETPIPNEVILENNIVMLTLAASGLNAVTTTTSVLLDIIKDDTTTPVFSRNIYYGTYLGSNINIDDIILTQGYDSSVTFRLDGDHAQYFDVSNAGNRVEIVQLSPIPEGVIHNEKVLVFNVLALKALTVGANAAVSISFPSELTDPVVMRFAQNTYTATIDNNGLTADHIVLSTGYAPGTEFVHTGDYSSYFSITPNENRVTLSLLNPLPSDVIPNSFVVLEIAATRERAVSASTSIVVDIIQEEIVRPKFTQPFYRGVYDPESGLQFNEVISLLYGHDDTVDFHLDGEFSSLFRLVELDSKSRSIEVLAPISEEVLKDNSHLLFTVVATKPGSYTARATISIDIVKESPQGPTLEFDRVTYLGTIQNDVAQVGPITIIQGFTDDVTLALYGDLAVYFTTRREASVVTVTMVTPIPTELIPDNRIVVLEIRASSPQANTAFATIVLEAILEDDTPPTIQLAFDAPFYTGSYNTIDGLRLDTSIALAGGHDANTQFGLQGENSQWFSVSAGSNSVTIVVSSAIPEAVLASNRKFVFLITAQRPGALSAQATIVISLTADESPQGPTLGFDRVTYLGTIQNDVAQVGPITIIQGFTDDVTLALYGDLAVYFTTRREASVVTVTMVTPIPTELIPDNRIVVLEIRASSPQANTAFATIVLEAILEDDTPPTIQLAFDAPFYTGSYNTIDGLRLDTSIALAGGHDANTQFGLQGENSQWFIVSAGSNSVTIVVSSAIPEAVLASNRKFVFLITAQRPGALSAQATIVISLTADESPQGPTLGFDRVTYLGTIQNDVAQVGPITIIQGFTDDVTLALYGDLAVYFTTRREASVVTVTMVTPIPTELIPDNRIVVLEIRASSPQANTAFATIVLEAILEDDTPPTIQLAFDAPFYTGSYNTIDGLRLDTSIALAGGHDANTQFGLQGENSQWFSVSPGSNTVTIAVSSAIPEAVLASNRKFVFLITAQRPGALSAQATIVISLTADESPQGPTLGFDRVTYLGTIQNDVAQVGPITIIQGFTDDVTLALYGDLAVYFTTRREASVVTVTMVTPIPTELIPDNRIVVLEIRASSPQANTAFATIVLEAILEDDTPPTIQLAFDAPFYTGSYNTIDGLSLDTSIALAGGHDANTQFGLQGENSQWFSVSAGSNSVTIVVSSAIPEAVLASNRKFVFLITAQRPGALSAQATIVIAVTDGSSNGNDAEFENVFYEGVIQGNDVRHELVRIFGYDGTIVDVIGDYSSLFMARALDGVVTVGASGTLNLPDDVTRVVLELQAAGARTAMVLNVEQSDTPILPTVTFSSDTYEVTVGIAQTGLIGRVSATTNNGEAVTYSLGTLNAHLQTRLSINNEGELHLSAPANSGVYTFQVVATSVITQATGTATVTLAVEAVTVCEDGEIVVPPLIIIDRDEEQAHRNLVVLDPEQQSGCHYTMTHRWPTNANWLYVDENGLHANVIDREHPSIAFMALSQVQVELILHCENDNPGRSKRSERTDWLGPYDYGTNKWILTDTILYNSRRSLVNLIVNDINDNDPIFVGKEHEPIVVGYPTDDLEERILPRSLVELKATDADVGENAQLMYSSAESSLAVAPTTGFVHVRSGATLVQDQILTVRATDQNGNGRTGTIQLMVKLLDLSHIAVVTVRDAFLDDETTVLNQLSAAVGYEVKALRSVVISDDIDGDVTRKTREANNGGASLQLYVYGLIAREPVVVERLTTDISTNAANVNVISTLTLEDHLEDMYIFERDIGLLVATIVLSVLLFMLIVLIAIWFFLRWRKSKKYNELSEENSIASRNSSLGEVPKPEPMKPRLNIEDLKRSEKRLQERLEAPIEEISVEPMTSRKLESPVEAILDMPVPEVSPPIPIVIQSIDKLKDADDDDDTDDEFGEVTAPRKSVVTFNENVEKIITVEDDAEDDGDSSQAGYEVYRL